MWLDGTNRINVENNNILNQKKMSVNKVILLGHVGMDPKMRYPEKGVSIASFSLATNEHQSEMNIDRVEWHNIVMTGRNAEIAERYIKKGTLLYIEGKLRSRVWEDKIGIKRNITESEASIC